MSQEILRLASIQPRVTLDPDPRESTIRLGELVEQAASAGAELAVFPEGYPGPLRHTQSFDAEPEIGRIAANHSCGICWSRIERDEAGRWFIVAYLTDREGRRIARYVRVHPATGDVHATLSGVGLHGGDELVVADFHGVPVGLLICSELWIPEVARILALRGAEVLLAPAGGGFAQVGENWQLISRARAIENESFVAMTSHMFGAERGYALIAGPEGLLAESAEQEVMVASCDLARLRWLRETDDSMVSPKPFEALPGTLRARRPELYGELAEPREGLYDYERPQHEPADDSKSLARPELSGWFPGRRGRGSWRPEVQGTQGPAASAAVSATALAGCGRGRDGRVVAGDERIFGCGSRGAHERDTDPSPETDSCTETVGTPRFRARWPTVTTALQGLTVPWHVNPCSATPGPFPRPGDGPKAHAGVTFPASSSPIGPRCAGGFTSPQSWASHGGHSLPGPP